MSKKIDVGQIENTIRVRGAGKWKPKAGEFAAFGGATLGKNAKEIVLTFKDTRSAKRAFDAMYDEKVPSGKALVQRVHSEWFGGSRLKNPLGRIARELDSPWALEVYLARKKKKP